VADEDGKRVHLEDFRGRVVLLNFWATWCKACEDEMPAMERLHRSLENDDFSLVAVSVDEDPKDVLAFRKALDLTFTILLDPDRSVANAYQTYRFPESFLIDAEGRILARYIGPRDWDAPAYVSRIRRLLAGGGEGPDAG
jgi:peroxiredoxin